MEHATGLYYTLADQITLAFGLPLMYFKQKREDIILPLADDKEALVTTLLRDSNNAMISEFTNFTDAAALFIRLKQLGVPAALGVDKLGGWASEGHIDATPWAVACAKNAFEELKGREDYETISKEPYELTISEDHIQYLHAGEDKYVCGSRVDAIALQAVLTQTGKFTKIETREKAAKAKTKKLAHALV